MKEITQEEFEKEIEGVIEGISTRVELLKRLRLDRITLNNKIQELYLLNPDLYFRFISKFPYKPREYTHIDYEAMLIDIMKKGYNKRQAAEQYEISDRTIARKVKVVEKQNPELGALYREVALYRKMQKPLPEDLQREVDQLEEREVFLGGIYDQREKELLEKEKQYNKTRAAGISDTKAYGTRKTIKDLSTLYRIELEQLARKQNNENKKKDEQEKEQDER